MKFLFWGQFCDVAKVAMIHSKEDLNKFGYNLNIKVIIQNPSIFLATCLEPCTEIWLFFLNIGLIMAIENLKKRMIITLLIIF